MRDFYAEFMDYRKRLLEGEDADLAAPPPPPAAEEPTGPEGPARVTGEIEATGRGINTYLAKLLQES